MATMLFTRISAVQCGDCGRIYDLAICSPDEAPDPCRTPGKLMRWTSIWAHVWVCTDNPNKARLVV